MSMKQKIELQQLCSIIVCLLYTEVQIILINRVDCILLKLCTSQ